MKGNTGIAGSRTKKVLLICVSAAIILMILYAFRSGSDATAPEAHRATSHVRGDTSEVWALRDRAAEFQSIDPDSSIYYGGKGYELARTIGFRSGEIWTLYQVAVAQTDKHEFDAAFETYGRALSLANESGDPLSVAQLHNAIGAAHYYEGSFHDAITSYSRSFAIADSLNHGKTKSQALNNLGIIYRIQRRYDRALEVYDSSLELKRAEQDTAGIINSLYNIGLAWSYMGDYEESVSHLLEARQLIAELADSNVDIANIDIGIGVAYYNMEDLSQSRRYLMDGLRTIGDRITVESVWARTFLGGLDVREGRVAQGLAQIEEAYQLAAPSGRLELLRGILKERAFAATTGGDYQLAAESWEEHTTLSDSLYTQSNRWAREEMQARFELQEKEITITQQDLQLEREAAQKSRYQLLGLSLGLLLLVGLVFMRYIWKQRRKLKIEVKRKEEALSENDLLLQEMHHRIKNNLQLLNSLLSLQSRNITNPEAQMALQASRDTVGAIGLLHHQLYRSKDFRSVPLAPYVHDLSNYFNDAFSLSDRNIELNYSCESIDVDIDRAIPLGLIINELVTNAIKHAFDERDQGTIHLQLRQTENRITLEVADNGKGVHKEASGSGTGKKLMKIFSDKLKAEFDYLVSDTGTLARFSFPLS